MSDRDNRADSPDSAIAMVALQAEKHQLKTQLLSLQEELDEDRKICNEMMRRLEEVQNRCRHLADKCERVEQHNTTLTRLNIATVRLAQVQELPQLYAAVQEIIANLLGSEEMALFACLPQCGILSLLWSQGVNADSFLAIPVGEGVSGQCVSSGTSRCDLDDSESTLTHERNLSACVVLKANGATVGALALFRLLPQKLAFDSTDRELLTFLETQLGMVLQHAQLAEHAQRTQRSDDTLYTTVENAE